MMVKTASFALPIAYICKELFAELGGLSFLALWRLVTWSGVLPIVRSSLEEFPLGALVVLATTFATVVFAFEGKPEDSHLETNPSHSAVIITASERQFKRSESVPAPEP
jgi:hypothetical protein